MSEFTIRSESVDVDQIMKQIRQRILEKRGQEDRKSTRLNSSH